MPVWTPETIAARMAIQEVLARYFHAADFELRDVMESCFWEDAQASFNDTPLAPGRAAILAFLFHEDREPPPPIRNRMHFMGNVMIELDGDGARTQTYAYVNFATEAQGELRMFTRGLRYLDDFARRGGEWRILRRRHTAEFQKTETPVFVSEHMMTRPV